MEKQNNERQLDLQPKQQQSLTQINLIEKMLARYPLISQRKVVIHSALEAVTTQDLAISAIDAKTQEGISLKWIKAQLIDVFNFCGAFGVVNDTQVVMIARQIRTRYFHLTPTELTYFFEQFVSGAYGVLYVGKTINPQIVLQALRMCENTLINQRAELQEKQEEERLAREGKTGINAWAMYCKKRNKSNASKPMQDFIVEMRRRKFNIK